MIFIMIIRTEYNSGSHVLKIKDCHAYICHYNLILSLGNTLEVIFFHSIFSTRSLTPLKLADGLCLG